MSNLTEQITAIFNEYSVAPFWEGAELLRYDCYLKVISWVMQLEKIGAIKQVPYIVPTHEGGFILSWENRKDGRVTVSLEIEFKYDLTRDKVLVDHSTCFNGDNWDFEEEFGLEEINERVIEAVERYV
jgi:hypothetical protein